MKNDHSVYKTLAFFTQITINMLVPIFLCSFLGVCLDRWLGTSFLVVVFFFLGALAGFRNVFQLAKKLYSSKKGEQSFAFRKKEDR